MFGTHDTFVEIDMTSIQRSMYELSQFERNLKRRTRTALRKAVAQTVRRAGGYLPYNSSMPTGFVEGEQPAMARKKDRPFPRYDRDRAVRSIKATTRQGKRRYAYRGGVTTGWVNAIGIEMTDPAGSVFDAAGTKNAEGETVQGANLIRGFNAVGLVQKNYFRVLLPAVIDTREEVISDFERIIASAALQMHELRRAA